MNELRRVTRRRVLQIMASAGGLALVGKVGAAARTPAIETWRGVTLGARASITICHTDAASARRLLARSVAEIRRLEDVLSLYRRGSVITELNRSGQLGYPAPDLVHLLSLARAYAERTDGAFDPTVQPLWTLYAGHFAKPGADPAGPDSRSVERVRAMVDYRNMSVATRRIKLAHPGMGVTLNGIAQGYITDRVTDLLRNEGLQNVLVDLGEVRGIGQHAKGRPWTVGLEDPTTGNTTQSLAIENQAVATSAGAATSFDATGRHHHLFDPRTGESSRRYHTVTVVAPTATMADALSTGFASMALDGIEGVLTRFPGVTAHVTTYGGENLILPA